MGMLLSIEVGVVAAVIGAIVSFCIALVASLLLGVVL